MIEQTDIDSRIRALLDYELNKIVSSNLIMSRNEIYDMVSNQLGIDRIMVRRIAKKMVPTYVRKYNILKNDSSVSHIGYKRF